jgi:hypothetical protein
MPLPLTRLLAMCRAMLVLPAWDQALGDPTVETTQHLFRRRLPSLHQFPPLLPCHWSPLLLQPQRQPLPLFKLQLLSLVVTLILVMITAAMMVHPAARMTLVDPTTAQKLPLTANVVVKVLRELVNVPQALLVLATTSGTLNA